MRRLSLLLILLFCFAVPAGAGESLAELEAANRLLRAEYDLATSKQLYFFCDLKARRLQFKTAGVALANLPIVGVRMWGPMPTPQLRTVATKVAPFSPQREKVGVLAEEEAKGDKADEKKAEEPKKEGKTFEIKALEISDMPTYFRIVLDDGLRIAVRPAAADGTAVWREKSRLFLWYLTQPLISNWNFFHDKPYTELHLTLAPKDVQLLYWSLAEGSPLLLDTPVN
jgi:hypothetical protein